MKLWDVQIDAVTREEARAALSERQIIFTPNPEILLEARKNARFREALSHGTLMLPDGHGLQFVTTLLRIPSRFLRFLCYFPALFFYLISKRLFAGVIPEVIHGSDFMMDVIERAVKENRSIYFLGGAPGVAEKAVERLVKKFPFMKVAGMSASNPGGATFEAVKQMKPEVLFVAYGAPKQEVWIAEYASKIPSLRWVMGVGGSFDFYAGVVPRAPKLLRVLGLEWLWRLLMNPWARAKRIWNAVVVFPFKVLLA